MIGRLRLLILLSIFVIAVWNFAEHDGGPRRPPPLPSPAVPALPGPAGAPPAMPPGGAVYEIAEDKPCPRVCTGTAFAIDDAGHWLTAQHVVEGCRQVAILTAARRQIPVRQVVPNTYADVSLLVTAATAPNLPLDLGARLQRRQDGFHIGFPASEPGQVHGRLIGNARARQRGRGGREEPILAWAEVSRDPPRQGSLGGLSGGAVLDREGYVIGVTTAESPRRGRVLSAAPNSLKYLIDGSGLKPRGGQATVLNDGNYGEVGKRLRAQNSVALVLCRA